MSQLMGAGFCWGFDEFELPLLLLQICLSNSPINQTRSNNREKPTRSETKVGNSESNPKQDQSDKEEQQSKEKKRYKRGKSKEVDDPSSETVETQLSQHIVDRFTRFIRFGGIIEMISERTNIPKDVVVKSGASQHQDGSSNQGVDYHAAHVVRAGEINKLLQLQSKTLYDFLRNFLGHTQVVPSWMNYWHGIGGDIDRFQEEFLRLLLQIDFSGDLTLEVNQILTLLKDLYLNLIQKWIEKIDDEFKKEILRAAKEALEAIPIKVLFKKGKGGFENKYGEYY